MHTDSGTPALPPRKRAAVAKVDGKPGKVRPGTNARPSKAVSTQASPAVAAGRESDPRVLYLREEPSKTRAQILAREAMDGDSLNAITSINYSNPSFGGELAITESIAALRSQIGKVNDGDLAQVEAMLYGQATALASIFHECARRSALNMGTHQDAMERYMRLALKAQGQCRTTLEALVEAKHPKSVAFVRQANIANGHQQINNGGQQTDGEPTNFESRPNELLGVSNVARMDASAPRAAIPSHTAVAAVGTINGATK